MMTMKDNTMNGNEKATVKKDEGAAATAEGKVAVVSSNGNDSDVATDGADAEKSTNAEGKRFLPSYKKPDAALTFPEKVRCSEVNGGSLLL